MGRRKQFINKKEALRFHVVHRSQRDPLLADPEATDYVLREASGPNSGVLSNFAAAAADAEEALRVMEEHDDKLDSRGDEHHRRFEEKAREAEAAGTLGRKGRGKKKADWAYEHGDFDLGYLGLPEGDGYDYSQHLKEIGTPGGVFYSKDGSIRGGKAPGGAVVVDRDTLEEYKRAEEAAEKVREAAAQAKIAGKSGAEAAALIAAATSKSAAEAAASRNFIPPEARATADADQTPYSEYNNYAPGLFEGVDLEVAAMLDCNLDIASEDELDDDFIALATADVLPEPAAKSKKSAVVGTDGDGDGDGDSDGDGDDDGDDVSSDGAMYGRGGDSDDDFDDDDDDDDDDDGDYVGGRGYYKDAHDPHYAGSHRTERETLASTMSRRTQSVRVIDEHFEEKLKAYDEEGEIGELELDDEHLLGHLDTDQIDGLLDEFIEDVKASRTEAVNEVPEDERIKTMQIVSASDEAIMENEDIVRKAEEDIEDLARPRPQEKWDCQTVLTTYSNVENHPRLIEVAKPKRQIRLERGLPIDYLPDRSKNTEEDGDGNGGGGDDDNDNDDDDAADGDEEDGEMHTVVEVPERIKGETPEEKQLRKKLVKEAKREARQRKKQLKTQFKQEEIRQSKLGRRNVSVRPI